MTSRCQEKNYVIFITSFALDETYDAHALEKDTTAPQLVFLKRKEAAHSTGLKSSFKEKKKPSWKENRTNPAVCNAGIFKSMKAGSYEGRRRGELCCGRNVKK